jgi:hypothetical protein
VAKKPSSNGNFATTVSWLQRQDEKFWERLQIFPHAVTQSAAKGEYARKALRQFEKLGRANLHYIANQAGIEYREKADSARQLANRLLSSPLKTEFLYLATFFRPRVTAVVEYFDSHAAHFRASALETEIKNLSVGASEIPKPLTKLVAAYSRDPASLEAIHYCFAWRKLPTLFEYAAEKDLPANPATVLEQGTKQLAAALGKIKHGEHYTFFGRKDLQPHVSVFVLHRKYPASVKPDYESTFRLQHDYSMVVFAIDTVRKVLLVKVANRAISEAIADWAGETLGMEFERSGGRIFRDYDPQSVETALLGGYDESYEMDLTAISFRHSFAPNHSRIALTAQPFSRGVREDLLWMKDERVLRLRSLADIESLKVRFDGVEADIECIAEKEGAVRLRLNDSHIVDGRAEQFKEIFKKVFGIPLGQRIDPTLLTMGAAEVYQFLLSGVREGDLLDYHKEALGKLLETELLVRVDERVGWCKDLNCAIGRTQSFNDQALTQCPGCHGSLDWQTLTRYAEDPKKAFAVARQLLTQASKWKMESTTRAFESKKFYRFYPKRDPNRTVCVFVNNRLNATKVEAFQRANFPILVVHPQGNHRMPSIDMHGIAHVGLPYALSAYEDKPTWKAYQASLRDVLGRLQRMEQELVLRASRASWELLQNRPSDYDDRKYESDGFNLLRSLFPYTVKWGGGNRPDGFCSLVFFPENDLRHPTHFNWSYDAKYSDGVYAFGIGEFDQMFRYVRLLHQPKRLKSLGNQYDAHVIITNSMDDSSMRNAADYLWNHHRLGKEQTSFLLVFMRDGFLRQLWQRVRENETAFRMRSTYLPEYMVRLIKAKQADGYSLLDTDDADALANDVLSEPELELPPDHDALKADLKRLTSLSIKTGLRGRKQPK